MTMITPSYLGETIEYSSLHACRSTLEDPKIFEARMTMLRAEFEVEEQAIQQSISESKLLDEELLQNRGQMVRSREADTSAYKNGGSAPAARKR